MKLRKKLFMITGSILTTSIPLTVAISCGSSSEDKKNQNTPTQNSDLFDDEISAKRLESRKGTWSSNQKFLLKQDINDSNGQPVANINQNFDVEIYETDLFKYAFDKNAYAGYNQKFLDDKNLIYDIIENFEKYVNIGMGYHYEFDTLEPNNLNKKWLYVEKPTIPFLGIQDTNFSKGGASGVTMIYNTKNPAQAFDLSVPAERKRTVLSTSGLMIHEYGHHETITSNIFLNFDRSFGLQDIVDEWQAFTSFFNDIDQKFITFKDSNAPSSQFNPSNTFTKDITKSDNIYDFAFSSNSNSPISDNPNYVLNAPEFVTRLQETFSTNYNYKYFNPLLDAKAIGEENVMQFFQYLDAHPLQQNYLTKTLDSFKKHIYGFDKKILYKFAPSYNFKDTDLLGVVTKKSNVPEVINNNYSFKFSSVLFSQASQAASNSLVFDSSLTSQSQSIYGFFDPFIKILYKWFPGNFPLGFDMQSSSLKWKKFISILLKSLDVTLDTGSSPIVHNANYIQNINQDFHLSPTQYRFNTDFKDTPNTAEEIINGKLIIEKNNPNNKQEKIFHFLKEIKNQDSLTRTSTQSFLDFYFFDSLKIEDSEWVSSNSTPINL